LPPKEIFQSYRNKVTAGVVTGGPRRPASIRETPVKRRSGRRPWKRWLFLIVFLYLFGGLVQQEVRLFTLRRQAESYRREIEALQQESKELQERIQLLNSDSYIEKMARERLGLVKPGETPYYPK